MKTQLTLRYTIFICSLLLIVISCKKEQVITEEEPIKYDTIYHNFGPKHFATIPYFTDKRFEEFAFRISNGDTISHTKNFFYSDYYPGYNTYNPITRTLSVNYFEVYHLDYLTNNVNYPFTSLELVNTGDSSWSLNLKLYGNEILIQSDCFYYIYPGLYHFDSLNVGGNVYNDVLKYYNYWARTGVIYEYIYQTKKDGIVGYINLEKKDTLYLVR